MTGRSLKLSFALGGGASLGSFSAAALTESLKQILLFARYRDENGQEQAYQHIELDVLSGSSAGAMALGLLLRSLVNYRELHRHFGFPNAEAWQAHLRNLLLGQFEDAAYQLEYQNPNRFESLLAVQAAQLLQERIWAEEIDLEGLLGIGKKAKNLRAVGSLADRAAVEDIARRYFPFQSPKQRSQPVNLLAKRLVFAATLSNLEPRYQKPKSWSGLAGGETWLAALNDAAIARKHGEIRVFDLHFETLTENQSRYLPLTWRQWHNAPPLKINQQDQNGAYYRKTIQNIEDNDAWRELAATCLASGAFPLVFEPVTLKRYRHEFGADWPERLDNEEEIHYDYFDGGALNNEPVREAARLAAYLDAINHETKQDRWLIFIDPNVGNLDLASAYTRPSRYGVQRSLLTGKTYATAYSGVQRLGSEIPGLLALLLNEAQDSESEKVFETLRSFEQRPSQRQLLLSLGAQSLAPELKAQLLEQIAQRLQRLRNELQLPPNTLQLQHELMRIVGEESTHFGPHLPLNDEHALLQSLNAWLFEPQGHELAQAPAWTQALALLQLDLNLNLVGKRAGLQVLPIAPFDFYQTQAQRLFQLPGGALGGFAGFASVELSRYEMAYGRYAAAHLLAALGVLSTQAKGKPILPPLEQAKLPENLKQQLEQGLYKRLQEMLPEQLAKALPFFEGSLKYLLQQALDQQLQSKEKVQRYEFRIQAPTDLFSLRNLQNNNSQALLPFKLNDAYYWVFHLYYHLETKQWQGPYVDASQRIYLDRSRLFSEEPALSIALPDLPEKSQAWQQNQGVFICDASIGLQTSVYMEQHSGIWRFFVDRFPLDEQLWGTDIWKNISL